MSLNARSFLRRLLLLMLLSSGSLTAAFAGNNGWTSIGPPGGCVHAVAGDPSSENVVYAGTDNGIFKSTNGGASWNAINDGIHVLSNLLSVQTLAIDPVNTNTVYAGTHVNILKSENGGKSWTELVVRKPGLIAAIVIDPSATATIYVGLLDGGILKSDDGGATWNLKNTGLTNLRVVSVAIDPSDTKVIYAATYDGIYKSTNGGSSWKSVSAGLIEQKATYIARVCSLAIDPSDGAFVYAGTYAGMYRSTNGGGTWSAAGNELTSVCTIAVERTDPSVVYAASRAGILTSTDKGASWIRKYNAPFDSAFSIHLTSSGTLYAGTLNGVFKSMDRSASWTAVNANVNNTAIRCIAIDRSNPRTIYAGSDDQGIFKTVDGGVSWTRCSRGTHRTNALAIDPSNSRIIYRGGEGGLSKSTDAGVTWKFAFGGVTDLNILSFAINPTNTNIVYAGTLAGHIFKSTNGGADWAEVNDGLNAKGIFSLQIDPSDTRSIYAAAQRGGVFKSIDGGTRWAAINDGITPHERTAISDDQFFAWAIAIDPAHSNTVYAATLPGVFRSTNGGANWAKAGDTLTNVIALAIDPSNTTIIYAGTSNKGVFKSMDHGQTWTEFSAGLTNNRNVPSLAINPSKTSTVYAGTLGAGIFQWPSNKPDAPPADSESPDKPAMAAGNHLNGPSTPVVDKPENPTGRRIVGLRQIVHVPSSLASNAIVIRTGDILLVRHEGRYGAVQAVEQVSKQDRSSVRYIWWYQPDGSGSFSDKNALSGSGEARLVNSERGPDTLLHVGPILLRWSNAAPEVGYVYYYHPDQPDITYELVISKQRDINRVDARLEFSALK